MLAAKESVQLVEATWYIINVNIPHVAMMGLNTLDEAVPTETSATCWYLPRYLP